MPVKEARKIIEQQELDKLLDNDAVVSLALERAEQDGIIFIDEIDKIAIGTQGQGPNVSREGVQRDILPIVEGCTVNTKYGPISTDYILFIAAGAFHVSKISDLIPELQGRFPLRVELKPLTVEDLKRILVSTDNSLVGQYTHILEVDNAHLTFTQEALEILARHAFEANEFDENIGARRLVAVMEKLLDEVAFDADGEERNITVDAEFVIKRLGEGGGKAQSGQVYIMTKAQLLTKVRELIAYFHSCGEQVGFADIGELAQRILDASVHIFSREGGLFDTGAHAGPLRPFGYGRRFKLDRRIQ